MNPINTLRRRVLTALATSPLALALPAADAAVGSLEIDTRIERAPRFALLLGNSRYPSPYDLPPVPKNVTDLREALEQRGFSTTTVIDQRADVVRSAITQFGTMLRSQPRDCIALVYFTGHGLQERSENLLVGADADLEVARKEPELSIRLSKHVIEQLPARPEGLSIAIIDACRTSLKLVRETTEGLNQVEAPEGWLISYSTGAGRPAIAPAVPDKRTFYTDSLVRLLASVDNATSFSELFQLVKLDVNQTMLNHPIKAIQVVAQDPFTTENLRSRVRVSPPREALPPPATAEEEEALWQRIEDSLWAADVVRLCDDYLKRFQNGALVSRVRVARVGAERAAAVLRRNDVRLYRSAFQPAADSQLAAEVYKAARGDKDAAMRLGRLELRKDGGRYEGWMQYAAGLGNGIASYELSRYYAELDQSLLAARYEARALELGYTPPARLGNERK
ncbi:caspase family protein [Derxia gummosa]|uniref:Caspase family protein n=1 Tax=Derxia gummosa DSM 723 TaxID=1121388 RepID=A0A8B6X2Z7_9BURK|nr:caspase family protein [Derxia gummosa]